MTAFSGNITAHIPGGVNLTRSEHMYFCGSSNATDFISNTLTSSIFDRSLFQFNEGSGGYCYSDVNRNLASGVIHVDSFIYPPVSPDTTGFFTSDCYNTSSVREGMVYLSENSYYNNYLIFNSGLYPASGDFSLLLDFGGLNDNFENYWDNDDFICEGPLSIRTTSAPNYNLIVYTPVSTLTAEIPHGIIVNEDRPRGLILTASGTTLSLYYIQNSGKINYASGITNFSGINPGNTNLYSPHASDSYICKVCSSNRAWSSTDIQTIEQSQYKLWNRISADTSVTPQSGDFHAVLFTKQTDKRFSSTQYFSYKGSGLREFDLAFDAQYPIHISGVSSSWYDVAHNPPSSINGVVNYYRNPEDSGVAILDIWHQYIAPSGKDAVFYPRLQYNTAEGSRLWTGEPITLSSGAITHTVVSGYFYTTNIQQTSQLWPYDAASIGRNQSYIMLASGDYNSEFHIYSAKFDLVGWVQPPTGVTSGLTLYTYGDAPVSSGIDLFLDSHDATSRIDLFLKAVDPVSTNNSTPLVVWTVGSSSGYTNGSTTLHTTSYGTSTSGIPLYINGPDSATITSGIPLYITRDYASSNATMPMFVANNFASGNNSITLIVHNAVDYSGEIPLFIEGGGTDSRSGSIPLIIHNVFYNSGGITLHTIAGAAVNDATLFIEGQNSTVSGLTPLYISSSTNSGLYNFTSLYTSGATLSVGSATLYVGVDSTGTSTTSIPLFIDSNTNVANTINLYLYQNNSGLNNSLTLHTTGDGMFAGAYISKSGIPLYIARSNENTANFVPLYLDAGRSIVSGVDFVTNGGTYINSGITFAMPDVLDRPSGFMKLYTHGF